MVAYSNTATPSYTITPLTYLTLPPSKHRWITSSVILPLVEENLSLEDPDYNQLTTSNQLYLVCGDRKGAIHIYILTSWEDGIDKDRVDSQVKLWLIQCRVAGHFIFSFQCSHLMEHMVLMVSLISLSGMGVSTV